jgi:hypothetical protein
LLVSCALRQTFKVSDQFSIGENFTRFEDEGKNINWEFGTPN